MGSAGSAVPHRFGLTAPHSRGLARTVSTTPEPPPGTPEAHRGSVSATPPSVPPATPSPSGPRIVGVLEVMPSIVSSTAVTSLKARAAIQRCPCRAPPIGGGLIRRRAGVSVARPGVRSVLVAQGTRLTPSACGSVGSSATPSRVGCRMLLVPRRRGPGRAAPVRRRPRPQIGLNNIDHEPATCP